MIVYINCHHGENWSIFRNFVLLRRLRSLINFAVPVAFKTLFCHVLFVLIDFKTRLLYLFVFYLAVQRQTQNNVRGYITQLSALVVFITLFLKLIASVNRL